MSAVSFIVEIVTPAGGVVLNREAVHLRVPGEDGYFGILAAHADLMSSLGTGVLELDTESEGRLIAALTGGFLQVREGQVKILAEAAELPERIDIERARSSVERARRRMEESGMDLDMARAEASLKRAINRIRVADRAGIR